MRGDLRAIVVSRRASRDQSVPVGDRDRLGASVGTELGQDTLDMARHGLRADDEVPRDLLRSQSLREQRQDLKLTAGEGSVDRTALPRAASSTRARDKSPSASEELVPIDRFDEVVVAADKEPGSAVDRCRPVARNEDDRNVVAELVTKLLADLEPA